MKFLLCTCLFVSVLLSAPIKVNSSIIKIRKIKNNSKIIRVNTSLQYNEQELKRLNNFILKLCHKHKVSYKIITSLIIQESRFYHNRFSDKNAKGLMQITPIAIKDIGKKYTGTEKNNLRIGIRYYKKMLKRFKGNRRLALAAYNAGPTIVSRYNGIPPYKETINYVDNILNRSYNIKLDRKLIIKRIEWS